MKRVAFAGVLVVLGAGVACGSPSGPSRTGSAGGGLTVASVAPRSGPSESAVEVSINGGGFETGATVTIGSVPVTARVVSSAIILATVPPNAAGAVDVVVTNPNGQSARLAGGYTYVLVTVASVSPSAGLAGDRLMIEGSGFLPNVAVTLGGVTATRILIRDSTIGIIAPSHEAGPVGLMVTNPGGQSAAASGGFRYHSVSLTAGQSTVAAGDQFTVSWTVSSTRLALDWIGFFRLGDPNSAYETNWWSYTNGAAAGTFTVKAPSQPGQYEFRYLVDDDFVDAARSSPVMVTAAGPWTAVSPLTRRGRGRGK